MRLVGSVALLRKWEDDAGIDLPQLPAYLKAPIYWLFTLIYCVVGSIVVLMYLRSVPETLTPIAAANLGGFWPLVFQAGVKASKSPIQGRFD